MSAALRRARPGPALALLACLLPGLAGGCRLAPRPEGPGRPRPDVTPVAGPARGEVVHLALGLAPAAGRQEADPAVAAVAARAWAEAAGEAAYPWGGRAEVAEGAGATVITLAVPAPAADAAMAAWAEALAAGDPAGSRLEAARGALRALRARTCADAEALAERLSDGWAAGARRPALPDPLAVSPDAVRAWRAGLSRAGAVAGAAGPGAARRARAWAQRVADLLPPPAERPDVSRTEAPRGADAPPGAAADGPAPALAGEAVWAEAPGGVWLRLSRPAAPADAGEAAALLAAAFVLAAPGTPAGLLEQGLRAERGLASRVEAHPVHLDAVGSVWPAGRPHAPRFEVALGPLDPESAGFALRWVGAALARLRAGDVPPELLADAVAAAGTRLALRDADPGRALAAAVHDRLDPGALPDPDAVARALPSTDRESLGAAARRLLGPTGWRLVITGPRPPKDLVGPGVSPVHPVPRPAGFAAEDAAHAALRLVFPISTVEPCRTTPRRAAAGAPGEDDHR